MKYSNKKFNNAIILFLYFLLLILNYSCNNPNKIEHKNNNSDNNIESSEETHSNKSNDMLDKNTNWVGTYEYEDESHIIKLIINPNNKAYFEGEDPFGPTHKFECTYELNGNAIEIYFSKVLFDKINIKKLIKNPKSPLYILSYEKDVLYTQTQFDSYGLESKNIYFNKQK